ncbi:hypothetical protein RHMOL_Rhmol10G0265500 [Rhododendron molle]|uniref:Uncharacterized protein n=2 Tax=Rhododendron molle TaxID=49168 RepID=A0ACC0M803_RHOML|nr:hypothetical protein RHMOL_Rhmol10G0265500 [Rhododendron molle]KAI8536543.1 hypothetical protein RHMOL_Rhmol10G0265500 [Rhododendron molle]
MASRRRTPSPTTTREIFTLGTHSWRKLDAACSLPSTSNLAPLDWVREDDPYTACAIQTGSIAGVESSSYSSSNLVVVKPLDIREDLPLFCVKGFRLKGSVWVEVYESGAENWTVRCRCGARDDDGDRMVSCDVYEIRQHTSGIEDFDVSPTLVFLCWMLCLCLSGVRFWFMGIVESDEGYVCCGCCSPCAGQ